MKAGTLEFLKDWCMHVVHLILAVPTYGDRFVAASNALVEVQVR